MNALQSYLSYREVTQGECKNITILEEQLLKSLGLSAGEGRGGRIVSFHITVA